MTTEATAPAPEAAPAPAPEATPEAPPASDLRSRVQSALKRRAGLSATEQAAPAAEPQAAPAAEATPEPTPEPEANPFEAARDKALADAARAKAAGRDSERKYRELEAKLKALETTQASWKEDPYKAAQEAGGTLKGWADKVADGADALTPDQQRMNDLQARLDAADAKAAAADEATQQSEHAATVQREVDHIKKAAEADSERFGIVNAMGVSQAVHARFYENLEKTGEAPVLADVMAEVAGEATKGLQTVASSDAGIRALLADETIAAKLREALGVAKPESAETNSDDTPAQHATGAAEDGSNDAPVLTQSAASTPGKRSTGARTDDERRRGSRRVVRRLQERMGGRS